MTDTRRTHTPGPWRVGDAGNTVFGPPNGQPSPQTIATLNIVDHKANARLIAAAPELLAALHDAVTILEGFPVPSPWAAQAKKLIARVSA